MKNIIKLAGIIALAAVIGFAVSATFAACGDDDGGGGGGGAGTLTITGLPNGSWSVDVFAPGTDLSGMAAISMALYDVGGAHQATTNHTSGNVFYLTSVRGQTWTVSGSRPVILINENASDLNIYRRATVNFSNGSATVPYSNFIAVAGW